ncbi:alpha-2A adrenergic receptor-like isoform X1 [Salarias fasciatus]|uniref:alpha-2A adrenergic receptor-like isoform X1 n=1 Tax=Salarias fasciatus TaxID=181472 RepID=UPI001176ED43|nr:alpha-2A adrenergic receptor-like isoform X1 [Salarias fasciatus]
MTDPNMSSFIFDFGSIYEELNFTYNDSEFFIDPATQPCNPFILPDSVTIVVCVFYVSIFVLAIPGNLVVGLVIGLSKQSLQPSDLYLLHLVVADLLLAVTLPFWATSVTQGWVFGDAMCKIVTVLQELSFYASILFLTCISMDRYLVIVRAMEARRANRQLSDSVRGAVQSEQRRRVAAGHQSAPPRAGLRRPPGHHAALLRGHHKAPAARPRGVPAAARHAGHRVRGGGLPPLLDAVPHRGDGGHLLPDQDRALPVPGAHGGGPGHVRHPEPRPAPQLRQPGAVRVRGPEVQAEAAAALDEDGRDGESVGVQEQQVVPVFRDNLHLHVRTQKCNQRVLKSGVAFPGDCSRTKVGVRKAFSLFPSMEIMLKRNTLILKCMIVSSSDSVKFHLA